MDEFDKESETWLCGFLVLPNGISDIDIFRRLFEVINPQELSNCLWNWLEAEWEERTVIVIDGKTIRSSANKKYKAWALISVDLL